ncbi:MAG: MBL fold metallo-hydrolase [Chloroflexi bacterium]|nr:MBL fold metallo-hydrolase [Chloroflexota bacterium]
MILERIKSEGLAHNSYFIGSGVEAAVVDPRRDCQVYVDQAHQKGLRIKHIFETHRNEDYVIGSVELKTLTGADIYHGPGLPWRYGTTLTDGQEFRVGRLRLTALHTPGHTDESVSYVLADPASGPEATWIFSGDTLFVGDAGRTDLYGPEEAPRLASALYDSIHRRILPLGDGVILCPAHGAGSVCGGRIADRDESTIGLERLQNPALRMNKDEFVSYKLTEGLERPPYFSRMERLNLDGPPLLGRMPVPPPLTATEFKAEMEQGSVAVDTSLPPAFGGAHIKGAYSIWLGGLPGFAGWLLPYDVPILLVLEDDSHLEMALRYLIRLGYDKVGGYLLGGIGSWYNAGFPVEKLGLLSVHELKGKLDRDEGLTVLDVRGGEEWDEGHIEGAQHIYVGHLEERVSEVPPDRPVATLCNVGRRSSIAASILLRAGHQAVHNVLGSMTAWRAEGFPVTRKAGAVRSGNALTQASRSAD